MSPALLLVLLLLLGGGVYALVVRGPQDGDAEDSGVAALIAQGDAVAGDGLEEALPFYSKAYRLDPQSPRANAALGKALAKLSRFQEALPYLQRAGAEGEEDYGTLLALGITLTSLEKHRGARLVLERTAELKPDQAMPRYYLGLGAFRLGEWEQAVGFLQPYLEQVPDNVAAHHMLVESLDQLGRRRQAVAALTSLVALRPRDLGLRMRLQSGRLAQEGYAATLAAAAEPAAPAEAPLLDVYLHARLLARHPEQAPRARAELERVVARDPTMGPALVALAQEDQRDGRVDAARARLEQVLQAAPQAAEARFLLAELERQAGRLDEARAIYEGLLGGSLQARAQLGILDCLLDAEQGDRALEFVRGLFGELSPGDPRRWVEGRALQELGRFPAAEAILDALLEHGRAQDAVIWRGHKTYLQLEAGRFEAARATFAEILENIPAGARIPAELRLWAGIAQQPADAAAARTHWEQGAASPETTDLPAFYTWSCRRLIGQCQREALLAAARQGGWLMRNDALYVEGLARELAGEIDAAREAYREGLAATRRDEFPGRLIRQGLERLGSVR